MEPMLPLEFVHTYDDVEILTAVPWVELDPATQALAEKVVDHYRMQASVKVDAHIGIRQLILEDTDPDEGFLFSLIATVEPVGDDELDLEMLFGEGDDYGD